MLTTYTSRKSLLQVKRTLSARHSSATAGRTLTIGHCVLPLLSAFCRRRSVARSNVPTNQFESMAFLAGQCVGLVQEIKPANEIVREVVAQAARGLAERA